MMDFEDLAFTPRADLRGSGTLKIAMLTFPGLTALDLIGPQAALAGVARTYQVWKSLDPLVSDTGVTFVPNATFETCPRDLDVLFIPGGPGQIDVMQDDAVLDFVADRGSRARFVTSACSGALVLGAAGLLRGYKATTHWASVDALAAFGAIHTPGRVVTDRNRITGGGVTAGLDFGLALLATLADEDTAKLMQLAMEYDPAPPFDCGSPDRAGPELTERVLSLFAPLAAPMGQAIGHSLQRLASRPAA